MAGRENNGIMPNVHDDTIAKKNPLVTLVVVIHKSINCTAALCTGRGSRCAAIAVGIALLLYKISNLQLKPKYPSTANVQFFCRGHADFFAACQWGGDWLVKKEDSSFG